MGIVGGLDIHRRQITFDCLDERSGETRHGRIAPADRMLLRGWLEHLLADAGTSAAFAVEGCTGWRFRRGGAAARRGRGGWATDHGLPTAELVADEMGRLGADGVDGPVILQSFDPGVLRDLRDRLGDGPDMVQLVDDIPQGDRMVTPAGLREISTYAQAIGPSKERITLGDADPVTGLSRLVLEARRAELSVFCWTLRAENAFLPLHLRRGTAPADLGDAVAEARLLLGLGVVGLISDAPDLAIRARPSPPSPDRVTGAVRGLPQSMRSRMTTFSSRPGPTPMTLIRAPESSSSRRT